MGHGRRLYPLNGFKLTISFSFVSVKDVLFLSPYHRCVMTADIAPIFLVAAAVVLSVLVVLALSRRDRTVRWLTPILAILAGVGWVVFLLYAFASAAIPAVKLR